MVRGTTIDSFLQELTRSLNLFCTFTPLMKRYMYYKWHKITGVRIHIIGSAKSNETREHLESDPCLLRILSMQTVPIEAHERLA